MNSNLIGVSETAKILGVSQNTVRRLADSGKLKCYRIVDNSYRKFSKEDVLEFRKNSYVTNISDSTLIPGQLSLFTDAEMGTSNISKMKNIKAKSHPSHYLMHKYWGRKAHNVVADYIINYTEEGDVVLDPFMGSGIVPIEAIKHGRKGVGVDINPMSKFIAENTVSTVNLKEYKKIAKSIIADLEVELGYLYDTICPNCGQIAKIEIAIWENDTLTTHRIKCVQDGIIVKKVDKLDENNIVNIESDFEKLVSEKKIDFPTDKVLKYVKRSGKESIDELFTSRALIILSKLKDKIINVTDKKIRKLLLFTFTSMLANVSNMIPGDSEKATYKSGWVISKFWTPKVHTERNIFHCFNLRVNSIYRGKKELSEIDDSLINLFVQDSNNLENIEDESIDYIFTDPPYGESIAYLALSQFWNSWLKYDVDYENEIIIDSYRNKDYTDFSDRIYKSFSEMYRVLKDRHYLSFTFHNRDLNVWKGVMDAVVKSGFQLIDITLQEQAVSSGTQGINRMNTLTGDFVYTLFKDANLRVKVDSVAYKDSKIFVEQLIEKLISENNGLTPSKLYELLIPEIVQNNAYNNTDGSVLDIEKILKDNFDYVEIRESDKLGEKFHWIKK
jgi:adenine-specific DNA methylase